MAATGRGHGPHRARERQGGQSLPQSLGRAQGCGHPGLGSLASDGEGGGSTVQLRQPGCVCATVAPGRPTHLVSLCRVRPHVPCAMAHRVLSCFNRYGDEGQVPRGHALGGSDKAGPRHCPWPALGLSWLSPSLSSPGRPPGQLACSGSGLPATLVSVAPRGGHGHLALSGTGRRGSPDVEPSPQAPALCLASSSGIRW